MKQKEFYPEESRIRKSRKTVCSVHGSMFLFCRLKTRIFTIIELLMRKSCKSGISFREQQGSAGCCQSPDLTSPFLVPLLNCSNVRLFDCFPVPSSFRVPCSIFLLRRAKTKVFTLIELLMRKSCKKAVSFRRCQFSPCLIFPFFVQLFDCSIVELFQCFSTSSFRVLCSRFLLRRVKIRILTLIELLIKTTCQIYIILCNI